MSYFVPPILLLEYLYICNLEEERADFSAKILRKRGLIFLL